MTIKYRPKSLIPVLLKMVIGVLVGGAFASADPTFERLVERDLKLPERIPLYLNHDFGSVHIQGSVQDRIRLVMKMRVAATDASQAEQQFKKFDLITLKTRNRLELRVGHVQGVDLVTKMRDRLKNSVQIDLEIRAPYQSDFTLVLGAGRELSVDQWRGGLTISGQKNKIRLDRLELSKGLGLNCLECGTEIHASRMGGRISIGARPLLISTVTSQGIFIEGDREEIRIEDSIGDFSVNSKSGRLTVTRVKGKIEFQSEEGGAYLSQLRGGGTFRTGSGQVMLDMDEVLHPIHVDSDQGDVQIGLSPKFEGSIDLKSLKGEVTVQFPYEAHRLMAAGTYGPVSPGRIDGVIGRHAEPGIHAHSKQGGVRLLRKVPL